MNKLVTKIVLSIALVAPIASEAASYTITPDPIQTSASFSAGPVNGAFTDTWQFNVVPNLGGSSSLTNVGFDLKGGLITGFTAIIDGSINLVLNESTIAGGAILSVLSQTFGALSQGAHSLVVSGNAINASYGGNLNISPVGTAVPPVGAVPIPGAVWLFGSALAGLMGLSRRKKTLS